MRWQSSAVSVADGNVDGKRIKTFEGARDLSRDTADLDILDPRGYHRSSYPFPRVFRSTPPPPTMVSPFPSLCGEPMHDAGEKETPPSDRYVVVRKPLLPASCVRSVCRIPRARPRDPGSNVAPFERAFPPRSSRRGCDFRGHARRRSSDASRVVDERR